MVVLRPCRSLFGLDLVGEDVTNECLNLYFWGADSVEYGGAGVVECWRRDAGVMGGNCMITGTEK